MQKTKIEWVRNPDNITQGFTCNLAVGCSAIRCAVYKVCYARRYAKRQGKRCRRCYEFIPHVHNERFDEIEARRKPAGIFLDSMGDLFDKAFSNAVIAEILLFLARFPQHRFYILTKQAQRLQEFRYFTYPPNLWLGVTVNSEKDAWRIKALRRIKANVKFVSFEPLYGGFEILNLRNIDWIIIGAQTRPEKQPEYDWVLGLTQHAEYYEIPVFIKNNLRWKGKKRQEFPPHVLA